MCDVLISLEHFLDAPVESFIDRTRWKTKEYCGAK